MALKEIRLRIDGFLEMNIRTRRCLAAGGIFATIFLIFFIAGLRSYLINPSSDAQIVVAFLAAPSSAWLFDLFEPLLDFFGKIGTTSRQIADWTFLLVVGVFQYFSVGYLVVRVFSQAGKPTEH